MSAGTDVIYNGVTLTNVVTSGVEQEFVTDPSGTDLRGQRVRLTFRSIVHSQNLGTLIHGANTSFAAGASIAAMQRAIEAALSQPRAQLLVKVNGVILYDIKPGISPAFIGKPDTDIDNGPHPRSVSIVSIAADKSFRISFTVEFMIGQCGNQAGANVVVSNRWSVAESRDDNFFTTRRISGHIIFSSSLWAGHAYMPWCIPGLEDGFKRETVEFDALANGLEATYQIVDRQVRTAAPWPATTIDGTFSWSTNTQGTTWIHRGEVTLGGPPDVDTRLLFQRAVQVMDSRINFLATRGKNGSQLVTSFTLTERIGRDNVVTASYDVQLVPEAGDYTEGLANVPLKQLGRELKLPPLSGVTYESNKSNPGNYWGYNVGGGSRDPATLFLLHCFLQSPCSPTKAIYSASITTNPPNQPTKPKRYRAKVTGNTVANLSPGNMSNFDRPEIAKAIYTVAQVSSTFIGHRLRVMLPLATARITNPSGTNKTSVAVEIGDAICHRVYRYNAERAGAWPEAPTPLDAFDDQNGIGYSLLDWWIEVPSVRVAVDGIQKIYAQEIVYVYGMDRPLISTDKLPIGKLPFQSFVETMPVSEALGILDGMKV